MPNTFYKWKRFWYPRGKTINRDYGGYLPDPETEYGRFSNPNVVPFESIVSIPCLVLLGEPGIGKSTATRQAVEEVTKEACLWFPLGDYDSDSGLCNAVFRNETFQTWLNGTHRLYLFLDSLDEGLLSIRILVRILKRELGKCPCDRLLFRITCRTADWSNRLEEKLKQLWGESNVGVYELAPLRRVNVIEAAKDNKLDPDAFLQEIHNREAVPLAIKPITLKFLIETYSQNGQLPPTQKKLYLEGCRLLCKEINPDRCDAGFVGTLTPDKKLIVAARIAAVTVFGNRAGIWLGEDYQSSDKDVTVQELSGGKEKADGDEFAVGRDEIKEALGTGLFSSLGTHRIGWTHQTYAEFIAAWYLVQHQMSLTQMMSLITHPNDPDRKLVHQLHETAAWLAGMLPDVFREIMKADPDVLLRSDVATVDVKDREALVENLLKLYDEEKLLHTFGNYGYYRKLNHPGLVEQLRLYIRNANKSFQARHIAIDIAKVCKLEDLQDALVEVALDSSQSIQIREDAASAVCRIGNNEVKARLKPLAIGEAGDDPNDELKGYALRAVWPEHITAEELFTLITPPKAKISGGTYQRFLAQELAPHLQVAELPIALKWVEEQQSRCKRQPSFEALADVIFGALTDKIIFRAWEHLESPDVLEIFAKIALTRWSNYKQLTSSSTNPSFESDLVNDDVKRRRLLEAIIDILPPSEAEPLWLLTPRRQVVIQKDFQWLLERLQVSESEQNKKVWAKLLLRNFIECNRGREKYDLEQVEAILTACQDNLILHATFISYIEPIEVNSPKAEELREWTKCDTNQIHLEPPPLERIAVLLDEFESGNLSAWWNINKQMTLRPDNRYYGNILQPINLTDLSGWKEADSDIKSRLLKAAKTFVCQWQPKTQNLDLYESEVSGYKALRLLIQENPDIVSDITPEIWKRWASTVLHMSSWSSDSRYVEPHHRLMKLAYQYATDEIINNLILLIDEENENSDYISIIHAIKECWDERLATALLAKVKDKNLKPKCMGQLLEELLKHKVEKARAFAEALIPLPLPNSEEERSRAIFAAKALMLYAEDAGWSVVWIAIQQDPKFGREVIESVSYEARETGSIEWRLKEEQVVKLYIWLTQHYLHTEKPQIEEDCETAFRIEDYEVKPRDSAAKWKNFILHHLKERGAYKAIQQIIHKFPKMENQLKWILLEAQNIARRNTWQPPQPTQIIKIVSDQQVRLVQSGTQLLEVLVESLKSLETELQGETPAAIFLWDRISKDLYKPKDENTFSDYVKLHLDRELKQRGIIVNREVEIRSNRGAAPGERTDIQVDAVVPGTHGEVYDSITAIIEVKGCWHEHIDHAMETQLVDRYLKDNSCQHGLYLVGWFNCNQWGNDYRKRDATNKLGTDINAARKQFDDQAAELSKQGVQVKAFVLNAALR